MVNLQALKKLSTVTDLSSSEDRKLCVDVDNRLLNSDSLFIAIVGQKYNPLNDLEKVIASGCEFVAYEKNENNDEFINSYTEKINFIAVTDITLFIQEVGKLVADEFRNVGGKIIAISGSNGKTTTKEMLYHIINEVKRKKVICTQKNNNNHLGVPFTLFQIRPETEYAIIELGSNHPGEIEVLCNIVSPQFGVTTNIGDTHLEFFGDRKSVFEEEGFLHKTTSTCFFKNCDDSYLENITKNDAVVEYGVDGNDYNFDFNIDSVFVNNIEIKNSQITGKHNYTNLAVSFMIAKHLKVGTDEDLVFAANSFVPTSNRSQWIDFDEKKVFLDAYNANPSSMKLSLNGFLEKAIQMGGNESTIAIIAGDMNELGENASDFHREVGDFILDKGILTNIFIGKFADDYVADGKAHTFKFESVDALSPHLNELTKSTKYLFIKGSRSLQLERILDIK